MAMDTVHHLGVDLGYPFFWKALETSAEAKAIAAEMTRHGVEAQPERSHLFNVFSPDSLNSVAISITPLSSKDLSREGGLSVSAGGHAQGVIVEMTKNEISAFTHFAMSNDRVVSTRHSVTELAAGGHAGALSDADV